MAGKNTASKPPRPSLNRLPPLPGRSATSMSVGTAETATSPTPYRVQTPQTDRSHLGELLFRAGILPQAMAATPSTINAHPSTLISPWTRGENIDSLATFLGFSKDPSSPAAAQPKAYITEPKAQQLQSLDAKSRLPLLPAVSSQSNDELPVALQRLQDNIKSVQQLQAHNHHAAVHIAASHKLDHHGHQSPHVGPSGGDDAPVKDVKDMTKVELWRHKHKSLPPGVRTPTFSNEEQVRYVPKTYVDRMIYDIRLDPDRWFELKERVVELKRAVVMHTDLHIISRNRSLAGTVSPERKRDRRIECKQSLQQRIEAAAVKRSETEAERLSSIMTHEERQRIRHAKQAEALIVFTVLGARHGAMWSKLHRLRSVALASKRQQAAVVIQRCVRKALFHRKELTHVQAFILRARLLRRFATRVKAKVILPKCASVVGKFLRSIHFEARILMAFRRLHERVVTAQRLVRRWLREKEFLLHIRTLQFEKSVAKRMKDFSLMATRGSSLERDLAGRELDDLKSITSEFIREVLQRYRLEGRSVFMDQMRAYCDARRDVERARDARSAALLRKKMPPKPYIRILIPAEQIERIVKNAARQIRLKRQLSA